MAAAVSNAGGLGSLGMGAMTADKARDAIREFRRLSGGPLNVNLLSIGRHRRTTPSRPPGYGDLPLNSLCVGASPPQVLKEIYTSFLVDDAMLAMLVDERPKVVSFHFGLPRPDQIAALHKGRHRAPGDGYECAGSAIH